jgi:hypothetical protein
VHVRADVALLRQVRRAGVKPNPDPDRTVGESYRCCGRRRERARCGRERDKKGVALRVDLGATVTGERLT